MGFADCSKTDQKSRSQPRDAEGRMTSPLYAGSPYLGMAHEPPALHPGPLMDLSLRALPGVRDAVWVIRVTGDIEVAETPRLTDALRTARQEGTGTVVLDLLLVR